MTTIRYSLGRAFSSSLFLLVLWVFCLSLAGCSTTDAAGITQVKRNEQGKPIVDKGGNVIREAGPVATLGGLFSPWVTALVTASIAGVETVRRVRKTKREGAVVRGLIAGVEALPKELRDEAKGSIAKHLEKGTSIGDLGRKMVNTAKRKIKKIASKNRKRILKAEKRAKA